MSGLIAIVGRPNVGKSALFNRIAGRRIAIVHDQPGVTRDRVTAEVEWEGRPFTLVDTGGIALRPQEKTADPIKLATLEQAQIAIESAHVLLLVVNAQEGLTPLDEEVASRLRRAGKPLLLVVNKVDSPAAEPGLADFARLGFENPFAVSAIHDRGIASLMKTALSLLPRAPQSPEPPSAAPAATDAPPTVKLAIVGRPNVGKSSLINALTRSTRVIVSPTPGTTRDAVDVPFTIETDGAKQSYVLIDTAGMRKARRVDDSIEFYSVKRAEESIGRCDIVILVLDAEMGVSEQDKKISDRIVEARKACLVVVNKWDLMAEPVRHAQEQDRARRRTRKKHEGTAAPLTRLAEFGHWVQERLFFLDYAPVIFASAKTGFHFERLLEAVRYVAAQLRQKIPTALLNRALHDAIERRQPVSKRGHRLKFFYATQIAQGPATFLLFVNRTDLFPDHYKKYLAEQLRAAFGYEGCPLVLVPKNRPKTIEPMRKRTARH